MSEQTVGKVSWSPDFKGTPGAPPVVPVGLKEHPAYKAGYAAGTARVAALAKAVSRFAQENDYCIVCDNHPSSGHSPKCALVALEKIHG